MFSLEDCGLLRDESLLVTSMAQYLQPLLPSSTERFLPCEESALPFFSARVPGLPLRSYCERLVRYMRASPAVFLVALTYLRRMANQTMTVKASAGQPGGAQVSVLTGLSIHRMLLAACSIAAKFLDDIFYDTKYYSSVGGVEPGELTRLEWALFRRLDFNVSCFRPDVDAMARMMLQTNLPPLRVLPEQSTPSSTPRPTLLHSPPQQSQQIVAIETH